jgi:hypothetical protein
MPTAADALALARAGWAVLPLNGKVPKIAHGVKSATTDAELIRQWWTRPANIGARVPASLVVLDFDPRHDGTPEALEAALGQKLPTTLTAWSGRGDGGHHRYYLNPGGTLSARRLPPGIDVKTSTGYCVMPPSLHPDTRQPYRWRPARPAHLPRALVELLRPPPAPRRQAQPDSERNGVDRAAHLARYVAERPEGGRNAALFWAVCEALRSGYGDDAIGMIEAAAEVSGLGAIEISRTVASARRQVIR